MHAKSNATLKELRALTISELKDIFRDLPLTGISKLDKEGLVQAIYKHFRKMKNSSKSEVSKSRKSRVSKSRKSRVSQSSKKLECGMDKKECLKTPKDKGPTLADLRELAQDCGIEPLKADGKSKSRSQLCREISEAVGEAPPPRVSPIQELGEEKYYDEIVTQDRESELNKLTKPKIVRIARKLGISRWNGKPFSKLTKADLVEAIISKESRVPTPPRARTPRARTPTPSPPRARTPTPSPPRDEGCYGGLTRQQLLKKGPIKLRKYLEAEGIKAGRPLKKDHMVEYLCALEQNTRCDPDNQIECDVNLVCDASNSPGVCLSPSLATERKLDSFMHNGKKYVGTKKALSTVREKLMSVRTPTPSPPRARTPTPRARTPTPSPPRARIPTPSPPREICYNGMTRSQLVSKKATELRELLEQEGIKDGRPSTKSQLIEYLCALENNGRCDPEKKIWCDGDLVCEANNVPGLCISPELAKKRRLKSFEYNGNKIFGNKKALDALQNRLEREPTPPRVPTPKVRTPTPRVRTPIPEKPDEGTEIDDIEEILNQIQTGSGEEIHELTAQQKEIRHCLGLDRL